jgi:predicted nucleic acid-binding protein
MPKTIISDTSCLIVLTNIAELDLLRKTYGTIVTTVEISMEFGEPLPNWIIIEKVSDKQKQQLLELQIDKGESSAIALALETPESTVILDDYKARKIAEQPGVNYTCTVGVIIRAKINGVIPSIKPILTKIKETDFRLSLDLEPQALSAAGEL